jgi:hypothetical protein
VKDPGFTVPEYVIDRLVSSVDHEVYEMLSALENTTGRRLPFEKRVHPEAEMRLRLARRL